VNVQINFQLPGAVPAGYVADAGAAYGTVGTYGWVREDSLANPVATPIDASLNARTRTPVGFSLEQNTLMHMHGSGGTTLATPVAWEYAIPNGIYTVTVSAGDTGFYDSVHRINVEGATAIANFVPNSGDRLRVATVDVAVADGRLTIDSIGGTNTKINYVHITGQPDNVNMRTFGNLTVATYNITESVPSGWNLSSANCTGGVFTSISSGVSVQLNSGDTVTCTFNNQAIVTPTGTIAITPGTFDFGSLIAGSGSVTQNFTLQNNIRRDNRS
jgi:hypothetical protein